MLIAARVEIKIIAQIKKKTICRLHTCEMILGEVIAQLFDLSL